MNIRIGSLLLLIVGVILLANDNWFGGQHVVGLILIGAWIIRWIALGILAGIVIFDDRPRYAGSISTPKSRARAKRRRARFDRRRRRLERWRSFKAFFTRKPNGSSH